MKRILRVIIIFVLFILSINNIIIKADSGWDSSYDSGSSWSSGSDWSSSSDWGSSFDWGSSGGSSSNSYSFDSNSIVPFLINVAITVVIIVLIIRFSAKFKIYSNVKYKPLEISHHYYDKNIIALEKIKEYFPNFDEKEFSKIVIKLFEDVQSSWMNFDYEKLRKLLTDELYNTYKSQLKALSIKKQQNIMEDFTPISFLVTDISKEDENYVVESILNIAFYDYVIDQKSLVIRGTRNKKINIIYKLTLIGSFDAINNKCPHCGAPLGDEASTTCEYCKSVVVTKNHKLVLSKKENINQGWY